MEFKFTPTNSLPSLDLPTYAPPAAPAAPVLTAAQIKAQQDAAYAADPRNKRSALGEIGAGALRGAVVDLPGIIGRSLQSTGKEGDTLYDLGSAMEQGTQDAYGRSLGARTAGHGEVVNSLASGASMIAPSLAPLALAAATPLTGGASLAAAGAIGAGMFGSAQYQDTYRNVLAAQLAAGKSQSEAEHNAHVAGLESGAIEAGGEAVGTAAAGRLIKGVGGMLVKGAATPEAADAAIRAGGVLKPFAKTLGETAAVETGTEMGQNYGEAKIEQNAGVQGVDPWAEATSAIGPTLAMTALMAPLGIHASRRPKQMQDQFNATMGDPAVGFQQKAAATKQWGDFLATQVDPSVKPDMVEWRMKQLEAAAGITGDATGNEAAQNVAGGERTASAAEPLMSFGQYITSQQPEGKAVPMMQSELDAARPAYDAYVANHPDTLQGQPAVMSLEDFANQQNGGKLAPLTQAEVEAVRPAYDAYVGKQLNPTRDQYAPMSFAEFAHGQQKGASAAMLPTERAELKRAYDAYTASHLDKVAAAATEQQQARVEADRDAEARAGDARARVATAQSELPDVPLPAGLSTKDAKWVSAKYQHLSALANGRADTLKSIITTLEASKSDKDRHVAGMLSRHVANLEERQNESENTQRNNAEGQGSGSQSNRDSTNGQEDAAMANGQGQGDASAQVTRPAFSAHKSFGGGREGQKARADARRADIAERKAQVAKTWGPDFVSTADRTRAKDAEVAHKAAIAAAAERSTHIEATLTDTNVPTERKEDKALANLRRAGYKNPKLTEDEKGFIAWHNQRTQAQVAQAEKDRQALADAHAAEDAMLAEKVAPAPAAAKPAKATSKQTLAKARQVEQLAANNAQTLSGKQKVAAEHAQVDAEIAATKDAAAQAEVDKKQERKDKVAATRARNKAAKEGAVASSAGEGKPADRIAIIAAAAEKVKSAAKPAAKPAAKRKNQVEVTAERAKLHAEQQDTLDKAMAAHKDSHTATVEPTEEVDLRASLAATMAKRMADKRDAREAESTATEPAVAEPSKALGMFDRDDSGIMDNGVVGLTDADRLMRGMSTETKQRDDDVRLSTDRYVPLEAAAKLAKAGIDSKAFRPSPYQLYMNMDISLGDADLVLAEVARMSEGAAKPAETPAKKAAPTKKAAPAKLTAKQQAEQDIADAKANEDMPNDDYFLRGSTHQAHIPQITQALAEGKNLRAILKIIATHSRSQFERETAERLIQLGLKTAISRASPEEIASVRAEAGDTAGLGTSDPMGRYNPNTDKISVWGDGDNAHTILHEAIHAATMARLNRAITLERSGKEPGSQLGAELKRSLAHLRRMMAELKANPTIATQYAFTNETEFLAEAMSNERFRKKLQAIKTSNGTNMLDRFISWVGKLLGIKDKNALEAVLRVADKFVSPAAPRSGASVALQATRTMNDGMKLVDTATNKAITAIEGAATKVAMLGNASHKVFETFLGMSSNKHITKTLERMADLAPMATGFHKYNAAGATSEEVRQNLQAEFANYLRPLNVAISKLPFREQAATRSKLGDLANEMTRLGINLGTDFNGNVASGVQLEPHLRAHVNELYHQYMQLKKAHPDLAKAIGDGVALNRKMLSVQTAAVVQNTLRAYQDTIPDAAKHISDLDILHNTAEIDKVGAKIMAVAKPGTHKDAQAAGIAATLQRVFKEIAAANSATSDTVSTVDKAARSEAALQISHASDAYHAAMQTPYIHLGRQGDYSLSFVVKNDVQARSKVATALQGLGFTIGEPKTMDAAGRRVFLRFDNAAQMKAVKATIAAMHDKVVDIDPKTGNSTLVSGHIDVPVEGQSHSGVSAYIRNNMGKLDSSFDKLGLSDEQRAGVTSAMRRSYVDMLPESSAQKALLERKGIIGASNDFLRNYANRAEGMTAMISNAYTMHMYDDAFQELQQSIKDMKAVNPTEADTTDAVIKGQAVARELATRYANSLTPVSSPNIDAAKAFGYHFYLALSPAFTLVNLMQPYHLTLPVLGGKYGFVKSAKELAASSSKAMKIIAATVKAANEQAKGAAGVEGVIAKANAVVDAELVYEGLDLTPGEEQFIRHLLASGQLERSQSNEVGRLAKGGNSQMEANIATGAKVLGVFSHYSELMNRLTAGLAGYNLSMERDSKGKKLTGDALDKATARAIAAGVDVTGETQLDYSDSNTARILGRHGALGKWTPLVSSFQNYAFQVTELLARLAVNSVIDNKTLGSAEERAAFKSVARKQLAGVFATSGILAGTMGMPLASVAFALANAIGSIGGGDDDPPVDTQTMYRNWIDSWAGKDLGEIIARGATRAVGVETSGRAGLQTIIPGSQFMTDRRDFLDKIKDGSTGLLGPAVGSALDIYKGGTMIANGDVMGGLAAGLPLALRNVAKAANIGTDGYTATSNGNTIPVDPSWTDVITQGLGFTPSKKAEQSEATRSFQLTNAAMNKTKAQLGNRAAIEIERTGNMTPETAAAIEAHNRNAPDYAIDLSSVLSKRAAARAVAQISGTGIMAPIRNLPQIQQAYGYANTGISQ